MDERSRQQRRRAQQARVYRRRRLTALAALIAVVLLIVAGVAALTGGDGQDSGAVAAGPSPTAVPWPSPPGRSDTLRLKLRQTIASTEISPKSVVSSGTGYVFAQNMMYRHSMTVYDTRTLELVKTIPDTVTLAEFGYQGKTAELQGAPVEAAESPDRRFMYISQYSMYGEGYTHQGTDACAPSSGIDNSFVYRVPLDTLAVDQVIKVGAVPKFLAVTPNGRYLLVSNWCSYTLSVVDTATSKQVKSIYLGPYPRGIAVDSASRYAYVAVMGSYDIARVDLQSLAVSWIKGVGNSPRHIVISPDDRYLYATLNGDGTVAKVNLKTGSVATVVTGNAPRSMTISPDGSALYVVNYNSGSMSKVRTSDMQVVQSVLTDAAPIGITYDRPTNTIWVCCYGGSIMVFDDLPPSTPQPTASAST